MNGIGSGRWANKYVGIPYKWGGRSTDGVDCYGLLKLVMENHFDKEIPDWTADKFDFRSRHETIEDFACSGAWVPHELPVEGDVAIAARARAFHHVGIVVSGGVLHALEGTGVVFEPLRNFEQRFPSVEYGSWSP